MDKWIQRATYPENSIDDAAENMSTPEQAILTKTFSDDEQTVALDGYRLHATNEPREEGAFPLWQPLVDNKDTAGVLIHISSEFIKDALPPDGIPVLVRITQSDKPVELHWQDPESGIHHYAALMPLLLPVDIYDKPITDLPWRPKDTRS